MSRTCFACGASLALSLQLLSPATAQAASAGYQQAILDSSPALYYQLDETSGDALNLGSLGDGFDAAYLGTPSRNAPATGGEGGVAFDGADDYLQSGAVAPAAFTGNPTFSAEAVLFVPSGGTAGLWAPWLHWGASPPGTETGQSVYFSFSNDNPTEAYAGFYNGGLQSPNGSLPRGRWHHVIWVRTGGGSDQQGTTLYIDGVDVSASLVADPQLCCNGTTPNVTGTEFRINRARDFETQRFFVGTLDEVALWDRALTPQEAAAHHVAFTTIFASDFEGGSTTDWSSVVGD